MASPNDFLSVQGLRRAEQIRLDVSGISPCIGPLPDGDDLLALRPDLEGSVPVTGLEYTEGAGWLPTPTPKAPDAQVLLLAIDPLVDVYVRTAGERKATNPFDRRVIARYARSFDSQGGDAEAGDGPSSSMLALSRIADLRRAGDSRCTVSSCEKSPGFWAKAGRNGTHRPFCTDHLTELAAGTLGDNSFLNIEETEEFRTDPANRCIGRGVSVCARQVKLGSRLCSTCMVEPSHAFGDEDAIVTGCSYGLKEGKAYCWSAEQNGASYVELQMVHGENQSCPGCEAYMAGQGMCVTCFQQGDLEERRLLNFRCESCYTGSDADLFDPSWKEKVTLGQTEGSTAKWMLIVPMMTPSKLPVGDQSMRDSDRE